MGAKNRHSCATLRIEWLNVATLCHQYPFQVSAQRFLHCNAFILCWPTARDKSVNYAELERPLVLETPPAHPPLSSCLTLSPHYSILYSPPSGALYPPTVNAVCFRLFFSSTHLTNLPSSLSVLPPSSLLSLSLCPALILHFGCVDFSSCVWVTFDSQSVSSHQYVLSTWPLFGPDHLPSRPRLVSSRRLPWPNPYVNLSN